MNEAMMRDLTTLHTSLTTTLKGGAPAGAQAAAAGVGITAGTRKGRSAASKNSGGNVSASTVNVKKEEGGGHGTGSGDEDTMMLNGTSAATTATSHHPHHASMQSQYKYDLTQPRPGTSVGYEHAPPSHLIPGSTSTNSIDSFRRNGGDQQHSFRGNNNDNSFRTSAGSFLGRSHDSDSPSPVSPSAAISISGGQHQSFLEHQHPNNAYQYQQHHNRSGTGGGGDGYNNGPYDSPPIASITPSRSGLPASGSSGRPRTSSGVASAAVYPPSTKSTTGGQQQLQFSPGSGSGPTSSSATSRQPPPPAPNTTTTSTNNGSGSGFQSQYHHPTYQRQHSGGQTLALATKNLAIGSTDKDKESQISSNNSFVQHEYHKQQSSLTSSGEPQRPPLATASTNSGSGSGTGSLPPIAEIVTPPHSRHTEREREGERDQYHQRRRYEYEYGPTTSSPTSNNFNFNNNDINSYSYDPRSSSEFDNENTFNSRGAAPVRSWSSGGGGIPISDNNSIGRSRTYDGKEQQSFETRTFDSKSASYQHGFRFRSGAGYGARPGERSFPFGVLRYLGGVFFFFGGSSLSICWSEPACFEQFILFRGYFHLGLFSQWGCFARSGFCRWRIDFFVLFFVPFSFPFVGV